MGITRRGSKKGQLLEDAAKVETSNQVGLRCEI